ncbi:MAG: hypothetical protein MUF10_15380, partial [Thermoanaerobaculaceae bacterium]|nr:hypothetical protein [Thermoanaerobaculaceae bacterium]
MYDELENTLGTATVPLAEDELWRRVPPSPVELADHVHVITTAAHAERMVSEIRRMRIAYVGFDSEFQYGTASEEELEDQGWQDPTCITPIAVAFAAVAEVD